MAVSGYPGGWTVDRVNTLRRLWSDGLSGSQIAARLGGVTRNAVIGKVHRLALGGRTKTSRKERGERKARSLHLPISPTRAQARQKPVRRRLEVTQPKVALTIVPSVVRELNIPMALRVDLLDLHERMCRWPIGHPKEHDFHFCGRQKEDGISNCGFHARIAFQPVARRA